MMQRILAWVLIILLFIGCMVVLGKYVLATESDAIVLRVESAIGPATADYIHRGLAFAVDQDAALVILQLDTPGGLDKSMRQIIKDIIASPIPVVTFVSPGGARAASAGTYILLASHVAAMAPGTNLGAATPVNMISPGGAPKPSPTPPTPKSPAKPDLKSPSKSPLRFGKKPSEQAPQASGKSAMEKKMINDAVAYIRGLAALHDRNIEWAEVAVTEGKSLSAEDALSKGVIDLITPTLDQLLIDIDGRVVKMTNSKRTLKTKALALVSVFPDWRSRILGVITSPDVAYILLIIGVYGLFFEFSNPGFILPGVMGGISLLLALYALQMLPVSYAGLGLLLLGLALLVSEAFIPSFGVLGFGGTVAFVLGSLLLMDPVSLGGGISLSLIIGVAVVNVGFFMVIIGVAVRSYRQPVLTGQKGLIGEEGRVLTDFDSEGEVMVHGERWHVVSSSPLEKDQHVIVRDVDGLTLHVDLLE